MKPNAVNLLDFRCKPIKGHAGGMITTGGQMIENSLCFQVEANSCPCIRPSVILSKARQLPLVGVCQNNGVTPLVISQAGEEELFTSALSALS